MIIKDGLSLQNQYVFHEGVTKDNYITTTKYNALMQCMLYTRSRAKGKKYELIFFNSQPFVSFAIKLAKFEQYYYEQIIIDNLLESIIENQAVDKKDGYFLFQFSDEILDLLSNHFPDVMEFSTPLFRNGITEKIDSHFKGKFYTKYVKDYFGHNTMLVRNEGIDKAFVYEPRGSLTVHQPFYFLQERAFITEFGHGRTYTIDDFFLQYNTSFNFAWRIVKNKVEKIIQKEIRF